MIADDDPRLRIPGPPGGERYLCPLTVDGRPCPWYLDVPPPEVEPLRPSADGLSYVLTVEHVPLAAVEARLLEHLRTEHSAAAVWARLLEVLAGRR